MSTLTFPKAVLWDMDGTLVDSEPLWFQAEKQVMAEIDLVHKIEHLLTQIQQNIYVI